MDKSFSERVLDITSSLENLVEVANVCDKAYCDGTGTTHVPFDATNPEKVAQNIAGLQAVMAGIGILFHNYPNGFFISTKEVLEVIAEGGLDDDEKEIMLRIANATWGAGQPFRTDKGPLGRATRLNWFDDLDLDEIEKDMYQIKAAAVWLLAKLRSQAD